jgi:hypothetical protein
MRSLLREEDHPDIYWSDVRVLYDSEEVCMAWPFYLPHEMVAKVHEKQRLNFEWDDNLAGDCIVFSRQFGRPDSPLVVPLGLHGDGTPCGAHDSLEQLNFNLVGLTTDGPAPRFMFTCGFKEHVSPHTYDDWFTVMKWSLECCISGIYPSTRHDGTPLDGKRAAAARKRLQRRPAGTPDILGFQAFLHQCRGDWEFYKRVFNVPSWSSAEHICWLCGARRYNYKDFSATAPWRINRHLEAARYLDRLRSEGTTPCVLFSLPLFGPHRILVDWLHTADLGCAADAVGNVWYACLQWLGANRTEQVAALWTRLQAFYEANEVGPQLDSLTLLLIKQRGQPPKLRTKAARVRAAVPFTAALAAEFADRSETMATIAHLAGHLARVYECLDAAVWPAAEEATAARRFALLYATLEQQAVDPLWRIKPKLHLFVELIEYVAPLEGNPRTYWTYRDEDYGGQLAKLAARRGGRRNPSRVAQNVLQRLAAIEHEED